MSAFVTAIGYILGLIIICCSLFVCSAPLKFIFKFALNSITGCVLLSLANKALAKLGFFVGINPITAVCVGVLGVPGAVAAVILSIIL